MTTLLERSRQVISGAGATEDRLRPIAAAPDESAEGAMGPGRLWPFLLGLFYLATGAYFVNVHVLIGDALSRTATARMVVEGTNPHLGALGWVWGPLPTLFEIPLTLLEPLAPWLVKDGYSGVLMSAVFGSWAAWHLFNLIVERGTARRWGAVLTAAFSLNPFVIIFMGNGMSEAMYLCFLFGAIRHLSRWQRTLMPSGLAACGCYLGLDCLVRFESLAAAMGAMLFVALVTWNALLGESRRERIRSIVVNGLIMGFPVAFFFALFIGTSWWLTNQFLAQYSSLYGQSAQIVGTGAQTFANVRVPQVATELLSLAPALIVMLPLAMWRSQHGKGRVFPSAAAILAPALLFDIESLSTGGLFNLMRYLILIIPIVVISLVTIVGKGWVQRIVVALTVASSFAGAWVITGSEADASQEYAYHQAVLGRPAESVADLQLGGARTVTAWLDAQHAPRPSILLDTYDGFEVLAETNDPNGYVIPADQNYQQVLDSPYADGVRYMVVIPPGGPGALYILNRYYPGLYAGCLAHTQLMLSVAGTGTPSEWRVYRLTGPVLPSHLRTHSSCVVHRVILG